MTRGTTPIRAHLADRLVNVPGSSSAAELRRVVASRGRGIVVPVIRPAGGWAGHGRRWRRAAASDGVTVEFVPHLRHQPSNLGLGGVVVPDGVEKGPRSIPERSSGIAVARVSGGMLPVRRDHEP